MAAYSAVISVNYIFARIIYYSDLILPPLSIEIAEFLYKELKSFQNFLERLDSSSRKRMKVSLERIPVEIQNFYEAFESHLDKLSQSYDDGGDEVQFSLDLQDLKQDTHSFIEKLQKVKEEYYEDEAVSSSSVNSGGTKSNMVGLSDEYCKLKEELVGSWVSAPCFSIVGMAGIGKTTLAMKIFQDLDIMEWFHYRAWVTVGKTSSANEIILSILEQVDPNAHELVITRGDEAQAYSYLMNCLVDKRYLIVLDDVWDQLDEVVWKWLLPVDMNDGCRVLLTTRLRYLVEGENMSSHLLDMRLLNEEESWDLLRDKIFFENPCPPELEKAGKKIAEKCDGLPLTIITVADLLSKVEKNPESLWIEVATHKKHQLFIDAYDEIFKVLYPSYKELRDELKLCFLYMGVFPLKRDILKSKLINLWIVEEVFEPSVLTQLETFEAFAATSLQHLSLCSLVMVFQKSSSLLAKNVEGIKTCGLHSSWWHFCQREARKNNFFLVLESYNDGLDDGIKNQSRLSIHNNVLFGIKDVRNSIEKNCASTAHSLLCFGPYHQYTVPLCFRLRLLQKLDALNIRFYEFPMEILELINLRYLALTCNGELPPSISKLLELQHLIVGRHLSIKSHGFLSYLPVEIWYMRKLKHLQVTGSDLPDIGDIFLENLSTLSDVSANSCTKGVLERIPNLKKLGIQIELTPDAPKCCFDHICNLTSLESLKLVIVNHEFKFDDAPLVTSFPSNMFLLENLKKLHLSGLGYPWTEARKIASLPSLEVLKLRCNAFEGPKWEINENEFQNLTFLLIEDLDLLELKGACGSFQFLNYLGIKHCYKLKEFYVEGDNNILNVEIVDCNPLVEREIQNNMIENNDNPENLLVHSSWESEGRRVMKIEGI